MNRVLVALLLVGALLFAAAPVAFAKGLTDDQIIFGDSVTIGAGERVDGNLVVFGGNATVEDGATITGDVVVFGGNVSLDGQVLNDLVVFGGSSHLGSTARVEGQLVSIGGNVERDPEAVVRGGEHRGFTTGLWDFTFRPFRFGLDLFGRFAQAVLTSAALAALALLVMLFWPVQTARVAGVVESAPAISGGIGLLTAVAGAAILLLLAITICLAPISLLGGLVLLAAWFFGWIALGLLVGNRLLALLGTTSYTPPMSAALGTLLISLLSEFLRLIPCVGWIIPFLIGSIGLGAAVLTRFGTQPYPPALAPSAPLVPQTQPPAPEVLPGPDQPSVP